MTETKKNNNKKIALAAAAFLLIAAVFFAVYSMAAPKAQAGEKTVTVEVIDDAGKSVIYNVQTDAEYLREVMDEAEGLTYSGTESEYGLMVDTVNGLRADYSLDGAYWSFLVNGAYANYGIEEQPAADGDAFQIVYTSAN